MNIFSIRSNPFGLSAMEKLAAVLVVALLFWAIGIPTLIPNAQAATLAQLSDTMTDTAPGAVSNHTIVATTTNGLMGAASEDLDVRFDTTNGGFDISSIVFTDVDLLVAGAQETIVDGVPTGSDWGFTSNSTDTITLTPGSIAEIASSTKFEIRIGTNATEGVTGVNQIVNPTTADHYQIWVEGTMQDDGNTHVAILDAVQVSASIDTTFTFTVTGVADTQALFAGASTTDVTTVANAIPFDALVAGTPKIAAHDLTVSTNAANGFMVTIHQDQRLTSGVGATIPRFIADAPTTVPEFWSAPAGTLDSTETYAHFGITSTDWDLNTNEWSNGGAEPDYAKYVGNLDTPREIFGHTGPSDGSTQSKGLARIGFAIETHELQPAGDYNNVLTYIATPTF